MTREREPILNIPSVVGWTIAALVAIHVARGFLSPDDDLQLLMLFSFIPARYGGVTFGAGLPGGAGAEVWSFITYAALHGSAMHLVVNCIWLLAFGSPVAWRFGAVRFLLFMGVTAPLGAAAHLLAHPGELVPMIGASAAISGLTAAAIRFVFEAGGPLGVFRRRGRMAFAVPAAPLRDVFRSPQILVFLVVWFGLNFAYGAGASGLAPGGATIAWQAHIGGFLGGLLLFPLFDPPMPEGGALSDIPTA